MARGTRVVPNTDPSSIGDDLRPPNSERDGAPPTIDEAVTGDADYRRASSLDAPKPRPGFVQMWIRVELSGQQDGRNYSRMYREGWRPRALDSVPKGYSPPTIKHGAQTVIGAQGMVLCEMPKALAAKRRLAIKKRTDRQMEAIHQNLMQTAPRVMQHGDTQFKSSVAKGKRAVIAED